jgi:hypothetical protein
MPTASLSSSVSSALASPLKPDPYSEVAISVNLLSAAFFHQTFHGLAGFAFRSYAQQAEYLFQARDLILRLFQMRMQGLG